MSNCDSTTINNVKHNNFDGGNCKSNNVVYLVQCSLCHKAYVGKTVNPLHCRMNGHRNSKANENDLITDEQVLSHHATVTHQAQFNNIYRIWIVRKLNDPKSLLGLENYFINKFDTKHPFGLNIDNPLGLRIPRVTPK